MSSPDSKEVTVDNAATHPDSAGAFNEINEVEPGENTVVEIR